ncbi:MAG: hypothetical protein M1275_00500 [Patescibacteria group bacterium]|nr:hypothetical protein [Patescibacteria group bacterium]
MRRGDGFFTRPFRRVFILVEQGKGLAPHGFELMDVKWAQAGRLVAAVSLSMERRKGHAAGLLDCREMFVSDLPFHGSSP